MQRKHFGILAVAAILSIASSARAGSLEAMQKAYFGSTKPGSWAKYEQKVTDQKGRVTTSVMTLSRLENEGKKIWFEIRTEPKEGDKKAKPMTLKYLLSEQFPIEKNALNYMKYIERIIMQADGSDAQEMDMDTFRTMGAAFISNIDYGANVESKGAETVEGKSTDHYFMTGSFDIKAVFIRIKGTYETDVWLSEQVPFGRVKEQSVTKSEKGEVTGRTESRLLETGTGATSKITGPVKKLEMPKLPSFGG